MEVEGFAKHLATMWKPGWEDLFPILRWKSEKKEKKKKGA